MRCREAERLIMLSVDDVLPEEVESRLAAHINECAACKREFEAVRFTMDALSCWEPCQPMRRFSEFCQRAARPQRATAIFRGQVSLSPSWLVTGLAALSLLTGAVVGYVTRPDLPVRSQPTEIAANRAMDVGNFENLVDGALVYSLAEDIKEGGLR